MSGAVPDPTPPGSKEDLRRVRYMECNDPEVAMWSADKEVRATTEATETQTQTEPGPSRRTAVTPAEKSALTFASRNSLMRRSACMFTLFLVSVGENLIQTFSSARPSQCAISVYVFIPSLPNESTSRRMLTSGKRNKNSVRDKKDDQMRRLAIIFVSSTGAIYEYAGTYRLTNVQGATTREHDRLEAEERQEPLLKVKLLRAR